MDSRDEQPILELGTPAEWRMWLEAHAGDSSGVWLAIAKGAASTLTYEDAVEEAVAFGWIDSKANRIDETRYKQWFSPRRKGSGWAASNKARVERLLAQGRMSPRGIAVVEAAKADGSWDKLGRSDSAGHGTVDA